MDQSLQNELQGLTGRPTPITQSANADKNVDVRWPKYHFVRRMRKDVLHQARLDKSSNFQREVVNGHSIPLVGQDPASFAMIPAEAGSRSAAGVEPASAADKSAFILEQSKEDSKSAGEAELRNVEVTSAFRLNPGNGAGVESPVLRMKPILMEAASLMQQPNQATFHSLQGPSDSNQKSVVERCPQKVGVIAPTKEAIAGAQISGMLELTASHPDSEAASFQNQKVLPAANPLAGYPKTTQDLPTSEKLTTENSVSSIASTLRPKTSTLSSSTSTLSSSTSTLSLSTSTAAVSIKDKKLDDTKNFEIGEIPSKSKTLLSNLELRPLAAITRDSFKKETTPPANNSTEESVQEKEDPGIAPPQPWPAATIISAPPNQPVFWNMFGGSNDSKSSSSEDKNRNKTADTSDTFSNDSHSSESPSTRANLDSDANVTKIADLKNTSSRESVSTESNVSSEQESVSSKETATSRKEPDVKSTETTNSSSTKSPEVKNSSDEKPLILSRAIPLTPAPAVKTQIGDVIEATYERDPKTVNIVHLPQDSGFAKNVAGISHFPPILAPINQESLESALMNFSCPMYRLLFSSAIHNLKSTHSETPAVIPSYLEQPPSQEKPLSDRKISPGQNRAFSGTIVSYYPLVMIPWVFVSRYPIHTALHVRFPISRQDEGSSPMPDIELAANNETTSTTPKPWTYHPNTHFSDILVAQKHKSGKADHGHFVQLVASPLFYVGESFSFIPSNKNTEEDLNGKKYANQ